jgi:hypothetical protein
VRGTTGLGMALGGGAVRGEHTNSCSRSLAPSQQAVPSSLKRYGLSQIINHLLGLGECCLVGGGGARPAGGAQPSAARSCFEALQQAWQWRCGACMMHCSGCQMHSCAFPLPTDRSSLGKRHSLTDPARPFDFLIDGELLRKTLGQHLLDHDISTVRDQHWAVRSSRASDPFTAVKKTMQRSPHH